MKRCDAQIRTHTPTHTLNGNHGMNACVYHSLRVCVNEQPQEVATLVRLSTHTHTPQHTLTFHHLVHSCPHATAVVQELQERLQSAMAQKLAARSEMEVQAAAFRQRLRYTRVLAEVTDT